MRALLALLLLAPLLALAQAAPACYPYSGDPAARMGGVRLHADGAYWWWYCWDGKAWTGHGRTMHRTDIARTGIDVGLRVAQAERIAEADRRTLLAQFDQARGTPCQQMIDNAGYAAALCRAMLTDLRAGLAAPAPVAPPPPLPPPPPPPPAEVWTVAPNLTRADRPTFAWLNGQRATQAAAERAPVGSPCDPTVGRAETGGSYFGVLGRADRVALCRKQ